MRYKLYIFDWNTLVYRDEKSLTGFKYAADPKRPPRFKPGVVKHFKKFANNQMSGATAVILYPRHRVGMRYALRQAGRGRGRWEHLPHEAAAIEQADNIAKGLDLVGDNVIYASFAYYDPLGQVYGPTPPERNHDLRWSPNWKPPGYGMLGRAMADHGALPNECLVVYGPNYVRIAADQLFLAHIKGPLWFQGPEDKTEHIGRRRTVRRPLEDFMKDE